MGVTNAKELSAAVSVLRQAAAESMDAAEFLVAGGPVALHDRQYVEQFLEVVNYNQHGELMPKLLFGGLSAGTQLDPSELKELLEILPAIMRSPAAVARKYGEYWECVMEPSMAAIRDSSSPTGFRTVIVGLDAAFAYTLGLLTKEPYCHWLKRCRLPGCHRFFLFDPKRRGPPGRYCSTEHSDDATRLKTRKRVARFRDVRARKKARRGDL